MMEWTRASNVGVPGVDKGGEEEEMEHNRETVSGRRNPQSVSPKFTPLQSRDTALYAPLKPALGQH